MINKMTTTLSALAIAAALMKGMTACTNDDSIAETLEQPEEVTKPAAASTVHITVGAGIGDEGTTRSVAEKDGSKWKLKFTEGDKIYFSEELKPHPTVEGTFRMVATLTVVKGSISDDGMSATFAGDATFYKKGEKWWEWSETTEYTLQNPDDPMQDCKNTPMGHIVHNGCTVGTGFYQLYEDKGIKYEYNYCLAADVATLMASGIEVKGEYDNGEKSFGLEKSEFPIFNCTISGLEANTNYYVGVRKTSDLNDYNGEDSDVDCGYETPVITDGSGTARFAIAMGWFGECYWAIWFSKNKGYNKKQIDKSVFLGWREVMAKVYNITKTAEDGAPDK